MKRQNAVIVAFLLLLLSYIILADETEDEKFSMENAIAFSQGYHTYVYCDNFYRKENNYTLRYPKILNLDVFAPYPGELDGGGLTLISKYNYIEKIEDGAFDNYTNLDTLEIFLNSLQNIDDKVLTEEVATSLIDLNLKGNNLQNLPTTAFQYFTNLLSLNLSYNAKINLWVSFNGANVTVLHVALSKLLHLDISYCNIEHFDDNVFVNLKSLQKLRISGNPITSVPMAIKSLTTLEHLHIQDSKIETIHDCDFCNLTFLRTLDHSNTKTLSYLHKNAFGVVGNVANAAPQLKEFLIESCSIQTIPENLLNWTSLSNFDIRHNPLKCDSSNAWLIQDIISASPSVYTEKITKKWNWSDKNFLACNPHATPKWSFLHILFGNMCFNGTAVYDETEKYDSEVYYVCDNKDNERFPCKVSNDHDFKCHSDSAHFGDSRGWHHLIYSFDSANIKILQKNLTLHNADFEGKWEWNTKLTVLQTGKVLPGHESTIKTLSFKNNKIHTIESGTFDNFHSLKFLVLSRNEITDINDLKFPSSLIQLYLNTNKLKLISSKPFENLVNLDILSVPENPNILPVNSTTTVFPAALANLKTLSLRRCNITMLDDNIFVNLISLENLHLGENPLTSIPTAINSLQNLKLLNISSSPNLTVLNGIGLITIPSLTEVIAYSSNIQRIESCAFCSFPNLNDLDLNFNANLSYIHKNAFGKSCNLESCLLLLSLRGCNNLTKQQYSIDCSSCNKIKDYWALEKCYAFVCNNPLAVKGKSYLKFLSECRRTRPRKRVLELQKEEEENSKENDSKDVDEKEFKNVSDYDIIAFHLSPFDWLLVISLLSAGVLVMLW